MGSWASRARRRTSYDCETFSSDSSACIRGPVRAPTPRVNVPHPHATIAEAPQFVVSIVRSCRGERGLYILRCPFRLRSRLPRAEPPPLRYTRAERPLIVPGLTAASISPPRPSHSATVEFLHDAKQSPAQPDFHYDEDHG